MTLRRYAVADCDNGENELSIVFANSALEALGIVLGIEEGMYESADDAIQAYLKDGRMLAVLEVNDEK